MCTCCNACHVCTPPLVLHMMRLAPVYGVWCLMRLAPQTIQLLPVWHVSILQGMLYDKSRMPCTVASEAARAAFIHTSLLDPSLLDPLLLGPSFLGPCSHIHHLRIHHSYMHQWSFIYTCIITFKLKCEGQCMPCVHATVCLDVDNGLGTSP